MLTQSQRLTGLLQELFAELPEVSERVEQDADALADIIQERKQAVARRDEWAHEITYRAEIGVMFKDTLSISPDGISWKGQSFSLDRSEEHTSELQSLMRISYTDFCL